MPPEGERLAGAANPPGRTRRLAQPWRDALIRLGGVWTALILLFFAQWRAMADQWWNISTYSHVVLIPVIIAWLVWQRAADLRRLSPRGWWPGLVGLAAALLLWLLGSFAGLAEAQQAGAVAMLIAAVPLILGVRVTAGLIFPMAYMAFLVPVGDEAIPFLQTIDARLTVTMLHLSHTKAALDGVFITTPAGLFEIAEACSGVKFLVAMIAFGVLAANICFLDWRRRAAFLVVAVVVPIVANGVRSWGTVYLAQFMGAAYAGGVDHIIYGWIFFAIVIGGTLALAWPFFDRPAHAPMIDGAVLAASPVLAWLERLHLGPVAALAAVLALALGAKAWAAAAERLAAPLPVRIDLPDVPGWHRVPYTPHPWWQPRAAGADHRLIGRYADAQGDVVDVFYALYASQGHGHKADGTGEGAVRRDSGWSWQAAGPVLADAASDRLQAAGPTARLAETTYASGDLVTGSKLALRMHNLEDRLVLRAESTMMLILSAVPAPGRPAEAELAAFRGAIGPLGGWMKRVVQERGHR
jgi:exosortase A